MNTWVDAAMLSSARCLITSPSGFSDLATLLTDVGGEGSRLCVKDMHACVREARRDVHGAMEGVEVRRLHALLTDGTDNKLDDQLVSYFEA
jgi:hypothetical protein